jgi:hypothetical protein
MHWFLHIKSVVDKHVVCSGLGGGNQSLGIEWVCCAHKLALEGSIGWADLLICS